MPVCYPPAFATTDAFNGAIRLLFASYLYVFATIVLYSVLLVGYHTGKEADKTNVEVGDLVTYKVKTTVPYQEEDRMVTNL